MWDETMMVQERGMHHLQRLRSPVDVALPILFPEHLLPLEGCHRVQNVAWRVLAGEWLEGGKEMNDKKGMEERDAAGSIV